MPQLLGIVEQSVPLPAGDIKDPRRAVVQAEQRASRPDSGWRTISSRSWIGQSIIMQTQRLTQTSSWDRILQDGVTP
jgi:hypothetical protein